MDDDTEPPAEGIISRQKESPDNISTFVKTHCMTCAAGWTRQTAGGGIVVYCLLDRERVLFNMTYCDRYELRDEPRQRAHREKGRG